MIIRIFKISTQEMWTLRHKKALIDFIEQETNIILYKKLTINQLIQYLPKENYDRVK